MSTQEHSGGALAALSIELADAVERAGRSVVAVEARRRIPGSGIIWPEGGAIVTADHILERHEDVSVVYPDGQRVAVTVAGRDPGSDLAVLRPSAGGGATAELAPAESVRPGNLALAVGRVAAGQPGVSFGIVSAVGGSWRTMRGGLLDGYLRADLTLYPGFSGGPLLDATGRVMGVNSSHLAGGQSVAIPGHLAARIVSTLLSHGRVRRAYLGVTSRPVELPAALRERAGLGQQSGLLILGVESGSAAEAAGLMIGDAILALGGQTVADMDDLQAILAGDVLGKPAPVRLLRGGQLQELTVIPRERS